jgi:hypothetical protein
MDRDAKQSKDDSAKTNMQKNRKTTLHQSDRECSLATTHLEVGLALEQNLFDFV